MTRLATNSLLDEHIKHVSRSIADDLAKLVILYSPLFYTDHERLSFLDL